MPTAMILNPVAKLSALADVEKLPVATLFNTQNDVNGGDIRKLCVCEPNAFEIEISNSDISGF